MKYSNYYTQIDKSKYTFKEDGIYSNRTNKKILGYLIGKAQKYYQSKFICTDGKPHSLYIHVALWIHFNGEIPQEKELNHKDLDKSNNTLTNLNLLTHKENMNWGDTQQRKSDSRKKGKPS